MPRKSPGKCRICESTTSLRNTDGYEKWYENRTLCHTCKVRTVYAPIRNPLRYRYGSTMRFEDNGKNPRNGICSICGRKSTIRQFDMHHERYSDNNPSANRIELCTSCHWKETWRLGQIKHNRSGELIGQPKNRKCNICSSTTTYTNPQGKEYWYGKRDDWMCRKCYRRLVNKK